MVEERKQVNQDSNSDNDMKVDHPSNLSHSNKAKRVDGSYGSSNGSTKDRDHSHSSSHNSKDDSDSNVSLKNNHLFDIFEHQWNFYPTFYFWFIKHKINYFLISYSKLN